MRAICSTRRSAATGRHARSPGRLLQSPAQCQPQCQADLGVNSLDLVVLVMTIEEHFHIEFEPSDLERLRTFADLARRVAELTASR